MFCNAVPVMIGKISFASTAFLRVFLRSSCDGSFPSRKASIKESSCSTTRSMSSARRFVASSKNSAGISSSVTNVPISPAKVYDFIVTRSTTPRMLFSAPIGIWIRQAFLDRRSSIDFTEESKSAPSLSILFTKQIRGTAASSA